jgi:hypothetical protein
VAEDGVLELELGEAPTSGERPDPTDEHEVDEGSQGPRMLHASAVTAEPGFGPPHAPVATPTLGRSGGAVPAHLVLPPQPGLDHGATPAHPDTGAQDSAVPRRHR